MRLLKFPARTLTPKTKSNSGTPELSTKKQNPDELEALWLYQMGFLYLKN
jgi:hypothetical protein